MRFSTEWCREEAREVVIQERWSNEREANEQTDYNVEETEYNNRRHRSQIKAEEEEAKRGVFQRGDDDPASQFRVNSSAMHPENRELPRCTFRIIFNRLSCCAWRSRGETSWEPSTRFRVSRQASFKVQGYRALKTIIRNLLAAPYEPTNSRIIDLSPYQIYRAPNDRYGKLTW